MAVYRLDMPTRLGQNMDFQDRTRLFTTTDALPATQESGKSASYHVFGVLVVQTQLGASGDIFGSENGIE